MGFVHFLNKMVWNILCLSKLLITFHNKKCIIIIIIKSYITAIKKLCNNVNMSVSASNAT